MYPPVEAPPRPSPVTKINLFARMINAFELMLLTIFVKITSMAVLRSLITYLGCYNACNQLTLSWWRFLSYRNQSIDLLINCFVQDRDLRHERVKCFPIHEQIKQFWCLQIYKYQSITNALVFAIVFGIHYNFFIVLPIHLLFISNDVFIFTRQILRAQKVGHISEVLDV